MGRGVRSAYVSVSGVVDAVHVAAQHVEVVEAKELEALVQHHARQHVGLHHAHPVPTLVAARVRVVLLWADRTAEVHPSAFARMP